MQTRAFDAVAIGASAGGIDALNVLLPALPAAFGPAVLIVVHVAADSPSLSAGDARLSLRVARRRAGCGRAAAAGPRASSRRPAITC